MARVVDRLVGEHLVPRRVSLADGDQLVDPIRRRTEEAADRVGAAFAEQALQQLEPVRAEAVQRAAGQEEGGARVERTEHGKGVRDVGDVVVVERDGEPRPGVPVAISQERLERNDVSDVRERLELAAEQRRGDDGHDLGDGGLGLRHTMVDEHQAAPAERRDRPNGLADRFGTEGPPRRALDGGQRPFRVHGPDRADASRRERSSSQAWASHLHASSESEPPSSPNMRFEPTAGCTRATPALAADLRSPMRKAFE